MIKEAYCSYEVSKLLKEKGFDWKCIGYYVDDEPNDIKYSFLGETNSIWESRCCAAPTHQMAMAWLREKGHNIILTMLPKDNNCYVLWTFDICSNKNYKIIWGSKRFKYNSYEDAVEAALKYCLENLI